jgi:hypothetical protein
MKGDLECMNDLHINDANLVEFQNIFIREVEIASYTIECKIFNYYCQFGYN